MMYCPKCGAQIEDGSNFCKACGENISGIEPKRPASAWRRLVNLLLDGIGRWIFMVVLGVLVALVHVKAALLVWLVGFFGYYALFEGIWQRTPAKWVTGTKVAMRDGSKPSVGHILLRALCMLIPFDAFSYLGNRTPEGWHDRLSHVLVVPKQYTKADVQAIDRKALHKEDSVVWIIVFVVGFVIVAGIVATAVLASLGAARDKANEAEAASLLANVPKAVMAYASDHQTIKGFCQSDFVKTLAPAGSTVFKTDCVETDTGLGISMSTSRDSYVCIDSTKPDIVKTKAPVGADGTCPAGTSVLGELQSQH